MTHRNEMTREELERFRYHRLKTEYTQAEGMELVNLVRRFINDRQASCFSCGDALREAKTSANEFLAAFGNEIELKLQSEENPISVEEIKTVVKKTNKNGNKGS
jgi:hypothetical protein